MKIILDECLPRRLARELTGHEVTTVQKMGWSGKTNGQLLGSIAGYFDLFITIDANLIYQQHMEGRPFALIVLHTKSNAIESILPLVPEILEAASHLQNSQIAHLGKQTN